MMAKFLQRVAGPEAKAACRTTQIAGGVEAGIEGAIHAMRVLWEEHKTEEDWGFFLIDARNALNEEKSPILLCFLFFPEDAHRMDGAIYPRLQSSCKLCRTAGRLGLCSCHPQETLRHHPSPCLPHPDRPDPWLLWMIQTIGSDISVCSNMNWSMVNIVYNSKKITHPCPISCYPLRQLKYM